MIPATVMSKIRDYWPAFTAAAAAYNLDPALLAAIATRETNLRNVRGYDGHGTGIMQIDDRYHSFAKTEATWNPALNIQYGAKVLADYYGQGARAGLDHAGALRAAVAGYIAGAARCITAVQSGRDPDAYTTGRDYSKDVFGRAAEIRAALGTAATEKKSPPLWIALTALALI